MNNGYIDRARRRISDSKILSIVAAKRAAQLSRGARPMVRCKDENTLDVAILEIAEGKLDFTDKPLEIIPQEEGAEEKVSVTEQSAES